MVTTALLGIGALARIETNNAIVRAAAALLMLPWALCIAAFVGTLMLFHFYLIAVRKTTCEYFRDRRTAATAAAAASRPNAATGSSTATNEAAATATECRSYASACFCRCSSCCCCRNNDSASNNSNAGQHVDAKQRKGSHNCVAGLCYALVMPSTQLLPMWQYEDEDDLRRQRVLRQQVLQCVQEVNACGSGTTPSYGETPPVV